MSRDETLLEMALRHVREGEARVRRRRVQHDHDGRRQIDREVAHKPAQRVHASERGADDDEIAPVGNVRKTLPSRM